MGVKVRFSKEFTKTYQKAPLKVQKDFDARLAIFFENQYHPLLQHHPLAGQWKSFRSINVTGDWRAIFHFENDQFVIFDVIGTHSMLYQ